MLPQFILAPFSLFSLAPKHCERLREPDAAVSPANSGFLAPLLENSVFRLQRRQTRPVCCAGASDE
jgi:hypothetical protein